MSKNNRNRKLAFTDYINYFSRKFSKKEQHSFEKKVMQNPFDQDAYDGISKMDLEDFRKDMDELSLYFSEKRKRKLPIYLSIAASIVLLGTIVFSIVLISNYLGENDYVAEEVHLIDKSVPKNEKQLSEIKIDKQQEEKQSNIELEEDKKAPSQQKESKSPKAENIADFEAPVQIPEMVAGSTPDKTLDKHDEESVVLQEELHEVTEIRTTEEKSMSITNAVSIVSTDDVKIADTDQIELKSKRKEKQSKATSQSRKMAMEMEEGNIRKVTADLFILKGRIVDNYDNSPLPGVNIITKSSSNGKVINGTVTDIDGNFEIEVKKGDLLVANFLGFLTEEIPVENKGFVEVALTEDMMALDEVVVVGYGNGENESIPKGHESAKPSIGKKKYKDYVLENIDNKWIEEYGGEVVKLQFDIDAQGQMSGFNIVKSPDKALSNAIINLIKNGPSWIPSKMNDEPIDGKVRLRIRIQKVDN